MVTAVCSKSLRAYCSCEATVEAQRWRRCLPRQRIAERDRCRLRNRANAGPLHKSRRRAIIGSFSHPHAMSDNPLLHPWSTPFGIPPFEQLKTADFRPAFDQALQSHWLEVDRIATQSAAASFDNTLLALERAGTSLQQVQLLFHNLAAAHTDAQLQALEREMAPRLAAHESRFLLDERLFGRIDALYQRRQALGLDPQSLRLLERYHLDFRLAGAHLPALQRYRRHPRYREHGAACAAHHAGRGHERRHGCRACSGPGRCGYVLAERKAFRDSQA